MTIICSYTDLWICLTVSLQLSDVALKAMPHSRGGVLESPSCHTENNVPIASPIRLNYPINIILLHIRMKEMRLEVLAQQTTSGSAVDILIAVLFSPRMKVFRERSRSVTTLSEN